jgi:hypothetical protein
MAAHIQSVAASGVKQVTKGELYEQVRPGDLLFCSGEEAISRAIEGTTASPWSHVLMAWLPGAWCTQWLTLEATFEKGVHIGLLADYVEGYEGNLVLANRPALSPEMVQAELSTGLSLLDDGYDWRQEVSIAARKLIATLPLIEPRKELYCSGLQYAMSLATPYPLQRPSANYPTPEDNWTDLTVQPVCALAKSG